MSTLAYINAPIRVINSRSFTINCLEEEHLVLLLNIAFHRNIVVKNIELRLRQDAIQHFTQDKLWHYALKTQAFT